MLPAGYIIFARSGPIAATVRSIYSYQDAQVGWNWAKVDSLAKRGWSAGSTTLRCVTICQVGFAPLALRAASIASSERRPAPSPIAVKNPCLPRASLATRSEERRVGQEGASTCGTRGWRDD